MSEEGKSLSEIKGEIAACLNLVSCELFLLVDLPSFGLSNKFFFS